MLRNLVGMRLKEYNGKASLGVGPDCRSQPVEDLDMYNRSCQYFLKPMRKYDEAEANVVQNHQCAADHLSTRRESGSGKSPKNLCRS